MPGARRSGPQPIGQSIYAKALLVDTGALLAIANTRDTHHLDAKECLERIALLRLPLYLSLPTIYETQRRILFDMGQMQARKFLDSAYDGSVNILRTEASDEQDARIILERHASLKLTLTDAVNMSIMARFGIGAAFSFDRHFLLAGFIQVPPMHL